MVSNMGWRTHELVVLPLAAGAPAGHRAVGAGRDRRRDRQPGRGVELVRRGLGRRDRGDVGGMGLPDVACRALRAAVQPAEPLRRTGCTRSWSSPDLVLRRFRRLVARPVVCAWTTACPLPRAMRARFTGTVTTKATSSASARLPQNSRSASPASMAPGTARTTRLSTTSIVRMDTVSAASATGDGPPQGHAGPQDRDEGERVAEDEGQHEGERDARGVGPAPPGRERQAEDLTDRRSP